MEKEKAYAKEYSQRPEVKAKIKEYMQRPEIKVRRKEWQKEYNQRPKVNERIREYNREKYKKFVKEENKRRKKLNLPLVGEGWISEKELLYHINNLFQAYEIITHCREPLMNWKPRGLELDIYIPELKLAFEYMGKQHYEWIKFFHKTKAEFEAQQYRDKCKKKLCKMLGITLIRIKYNEKLSEQLILFKLKHFDLSTVQKKI